MVYGRGDRGLGRGRDAHGRIIELTQFALPRQQATSKQLSSATERYSRGREGTDESVGNIKNRQKGNIRDLIFLRPKELVPEHRVLIREHHIRFTR